MMQNEEVKEEKDYSDYIDMDFFAEKMSPDTFRWKHGLQPWDQVEPFYNDKFYETMSPFDVNYKWYKKVELVNYLPNRFIF